MHGLIAIVLFYLPFLLTAGLVATGDVPWYVAGAIGYTVDLFLVWCFDSEVK